MMNAEQYLSGSRLYRRLRNGPHGELVEHYAARLIEVGLSGERMSRSLNLVDDLLSWIANSRSALTGLGERMVERYLRNRAQKRSIYKGDRLALKRFLSVLRDTDMIAPAEPPRITPEDQLEFLEAL